MTQRAGPRPVSRGAAKMADAIKDSVPDPATDTLPEIVVDTSLTASVDSGEQGRVETKEHVAGKTYQTGEGVTRRPIGGEAPPTPHPLSVAAGCATPGICRFIRISSNPDGSKKWGCEVCNAVVSGFA